MAHSTGPLIADPFHIRSVKRSGATTRPAAAAICERYGWAEWLNPEFQQRVLERMSKRSRDLKREFGHGPAGFGLLAK
jgi:hypothetical protein